MNYFSYGFILLIITSFHCFSAELPGLSLNTLRIIYPEQSQHGESITFTNNTKKTYLIQSRVRQMDPVSNEVTSLPAPFIVIPPMVKVQAGGSSILRILKTGYGLPNNKESVVYLSVKMIPAIDDKERSTVNTAIVNNIRVFFRPEILHSGGVTDATRRLTFYLNRQSVVVKNATAYYVPLVSLIVNGININKMALRVMVPPMGTVSYPLPDKSYVKGGNVLWSAMEEDGHQTKVYHQML